MSIFWTPEEIHREKSHQQLVSPKEIKNHVFQILRFNTSFVGRNRCHATASC